MNNSVFIGTELPQVTELKARLVAVEDERDAARERVKHCETRMMRYAMELAEMQAERDTAQAGEARAVEALKAVIAGAYPHEEEIWTMEGAVLRHVHRVLDQYEPTLDNQPNVLDCLDQLRAENERLRKALGEIAAVTGQLGPDRASSQYMAEQAYAIASAFLANAEPGEV